MCDCFEKTGKELKKHVESSGVPMVGEPDFDGTGLRILPDGEMAFFTSTGVSYTGLKTLKNGTTKECKQKTRIVHTYCPICGKKYVPDDNEK